MIIEKWWLIEIVATLAATGTLMALVRYWTRRWALAPVLASLSGVAFLCGLYLLGLPSAGYILIALILILALAYLISMLL